ncbi:MAG: hypothetical protein ACREDM_03120 [Methylocella sp.]
MPKAAANRLGCNLPANTRAFETFLTDLEPMLSEFIGAHPRCLANPDLPAVRCAIRQFMEEQAPSNFSKERWKASYDPARKVTYCSWFLGTLVYFLDKLDFRSLVPPPVEPEALVFISLHNQLGIVRRATRRCHGLWCAGASRQCGNQPQQAGDSGDVDIGRMSDVTARDP